MCVIIAKPAGVKLPDEELLNACRMSNPHGQGFAVPGRVFKNMNYNRFLEEIQKQDESLPMIIHFRLATHGSTKQSNCHPFRDDEYIFAHNGILNINPIGDLTDSETAFRYKIMPAIRAYGWKSRAADYQINKIRGYSKFAMMKNDDLRLFGEFTNIDGQRKKKDLLFSNLRFMTYMRRFGKRYNDYVFNHFYGYEYDETGCLVM